MLDDQRSSDSSLLRTLHTFKTDASTSIRRNQLRRTVTVYLCIITDSGPTFRAQRSEQK